jgi:hypothetical protein
MEVACDTVDAGDQKMYRLSPQRLLEVLLSKASRMVKNGLPASMEERFILSALEAPIMSIKREESNISIATETTPTTIEDPSSQAEIPGTATPSESMDSRSTVQSVSTAVTTISTTSSTAETVVKPLEAPEGVPHLLRLRTAFTLILESYIPTSLHAPLQKLLAERKSPDFAPLTSHLAHLASLRAEATALRSLSDNISRKRGFEADDEAEAKREEKKRKKEEEERKKKNESRGVKQLKKADVSGMKKLSSFFTKAPAKKT